ncbi:MAG: ABC transporter substrate-binding protein [Oscillospiraceae bacterium]|nr:ABC transporter substrate-binding protein [Oscillospiraceae bacterium]
MKKVVVVLLVAAVLGSMFLFTGCGNDQDVTPPASGTTDGGTDAGTANDDAHLIVVQPMMPNSFDPSLTNDVPSARAHALIYQTLVYQDHNRNIIPGLATSWEFLDAQTVVFTLREGVRFHNGNILTADDVAFSLNRAGESSHIAAITGFISEAVVLSDHEVKLITEEPFAPLLNHLAHSAASIVNREEVERIGDEAHGQHPIGTGPFRFHSFTAGDRYELVRFDDFNSVVPGMAEGALPVIEHITFRVVPEAAIRTIELETGAAHILIDAAASEVARIVEHNDLIMYEIPNFAVNTWLGFNTQRAPFDDIRVRQAIAYAIDIPTIVDVAWAGLGSVAQGPLPTTVRGAVTFPPIEQNIARARELMAEAGLEDGFSTDIWVNEGNAMRADAAVMIQAQLRALNIETQINIYEWGVLLPATAAGEHGMSLMGWTTVTGDPDYGLYPVYHSSNWGEGGNRNFYRNPRVDELLIIGRTSPDDAVRMEAYREAQELIMADLPLIPLWQASELYATRDNVGGFIGLPTGIINLWMVYFE